MARHSKKRRNPARRRRAVVARRHIRRRRNPHYVRRVKRGSYLYANPRRRRRNPGRRRIMRRRNPSISSMGSGLKKTVMGSLYLIGGAVATRSITQLVLKDKNTGPMGYVGNAVSAVAVGFAASKIFKSKEVGAMVTMGGIVGVVLRLLQDYTPLGQYVNLQLSGLGLRGDIGMGAIVPTTFFVPLAPGGAPSDVANVALPGAVRALAAPPASAMRGLGAGTGRYSGKGRYS